MKPSSNITESILSKSFQSQFILPVPACVYCEYLLWKVRILIFGLTTVIRHEAIMLEKLSIMLLSSAQNITYYAFENCPLFPKLCHHKLLIMPVYCCIRPFSLMFKLQIVLNSLAGCCIRVFHFNVTVLLVFSDCSIRVSIFLNGIVQSADFPTVKAL